MWEKANFYFHNTFTNNPECSAALYKINLHSMIFWHNPSVLLTLVTLFCGLMSNAREFLKKPIDLAKVIIVTRSACAGSAYVCPTRELGWFKSSLAHQACQWVSCRLYDTRARSVRLGFFVTGTTVAGSSLEPTRATAHSDSDCRGSGVGLELGVLFRRRVGRTHRQFKPVYYIAFSYIVDICQ